MLSLLMDEVIHLNFPPLHTTSSALLTNSLPLSKTRHKNLERHLTLKAIMSNLTFTCLEIYNKFYTIKMW